MFTLVIQSQFLYLCGIIINPIQNQKQYFCSVQYHSLSQALTWELRDLKLRNFSNRSIVTDKLLYTLDKCSWGSVLLIKIINYFYFHKFTHW